MEKSHLNMKRKVKVINGDKASVQASDQDVDFSVCSC